MQSNQLEIEVPIERHAEDHYKSAKEQYEKDKGRKDMSPVLFCYNSTTKQYFVSVFFSIEFIQKYYRGTIKIIHDKHFIK